jgi:LmbE family N-acetylglucosaminyl deacetylase
MSKVILVVCAHADDEALGCGGTMARHAAEGDEVHVIFLADGVSSRALVSDDDLDVRNMACEKACAILGVKSTTHFGLPDNCLDTVPFIEIVQLLEQVMTELVPNVVYTHHYGDLNIDHRTCNQAVLTACRPTPGASVSEIYSFEVLSSTEFSAPGVLSFNPNVFVDISSYLQSKMAALAEYALEMREVPHSRSIAHVISLSEHRGNSMGMLNAEGFMLLRKIKCK